MKNFVMQDTIKITQRIRKVEKMNCRVEVKQLRLENNSKMETMKILSENVSSIATSTNTQVQGREITQTSNSSNDMLYHFPNKIWQTRQPK